MKNSENQILLSQNLAAGYAGRPVTEPVSFEALPGQILTLIGPNGAGKSTLLKTIARQLLPVRGTVWLAGEQLFSLTEQQAAKRLSVLLTGRLRTELTSCREVVSAGRYPYTGRLGILSKEDWLQVDRALELVGASDLSDRDFNRISDGQRQRILLARAICQQPQVLVLDEPTSFLDIRHKLELLFILKQLVEEQKLAVVMSLHELDLAQKISDRVLCITADGRPDRYGSPEEVFTQDYIASLYQLERGSYNSLFGCVELEASSGPAQVFVVGGAGSGIPIYRRLQRQGIPFAAGVLGENDLELPVAKALSCALITEKAFYPIGREALHRAQQLLSGCQVLVCCCRQFGPLNEANQNLLEQAKKQGISVLFEWPANAEQAKSILKRKV